MKKLRHAPRGFLIFGVGLLIWGGVMNAAAQDGGRADAEDDLAPLSDEFEDAETLTDWVQFHELEEWPNRIAAVDINETNEGLLTLDMDTSGWYADYHGAYMFKEVTGDFVAVTRLWAKGRETDISTQLWSLTGIMVRTPRDITSETWTPNGEDWIFITTGIARVLDSPVFENKTTVDSNSVLELTPAREGWMELAVIRIGEEFGLFYRYEGEAEWEWLRRYSRPDMPETLQVGLNAYTDWAPIEGMSAEAYNYISITDGNPDLVVLVDYFRYSRPVLTDDFVTDSVVPDQWLALLPE